MTDRESLGAVSLGAVDEPTWCIECVRLDEQLGIMRRYGQDDVLLVSSALTPEQVAWAEANGVEARESRLPTPGLLYLVNREGIDLGMDGDV